MWFDVLRLSCGLSSICQESCWALSSHLYICRHFLTWKQLIERCLMFFSFPKALKHSRLVCSDLRKLHDWGYQDLPMCLLARNKQHYSKTWANIICETCLVEFPSLWTGFYFEALHHWQDLAECLTQSLIDVILAHPQYGVQFVKTYFSMLLYVYRYLYWLVTCSGSWLLSFNQHVPHCLQLI